MTDVWRRLKAANSTSSDEWFPSHDDVYQSAIEEVKTMLTHPDHLNRVSYLRLEYEKKKNS